MDLFSTASLSTEGTKCLMKGTIVIYNFKPRGVILGFNNSKCVVVRYSLTSSFPSFERIQ